jgi:hypothetical protein
VKRTAGFLPKVPFFVAFRAAKMAIFTEKKHESALGPKLCVQFTHLAWRISTANHVTFWLVTQNVFLEDEEVSFLFERCTSFSALNQRSTFNGLHMLWFYLHSNPGTSPLLCEDLIRERTD